MKLNKTYVEEYHSFVDVCYLFLHDKTCDEAMGFVEIAALCVLEFIAKNRYIKDYTKYPEIAVLISHYIENSMRDYIEYHSDKEYMKCKTNLSSVYGSVSAEDAGNAD